MTKKAKSGSASKDKAGTSKKFFEEKAIVLKRVVQKEKELEILKQFDLNYKYGPAYGMNFKSCRFSSNI